MHAPTNAYIHKNYAYIHAHIHATYMEAYIHTYTWKHTFRHNTYMRTFIRGVPQVNYLTIAAQNWITRHEILLQELSCIWSATNSRTTFLNSQCVLYGGPHAANWQVPRWVSSSQEWYSLRGPILWANWPSMDIWKHLIDPVTARAQ